VATLGRLRPVPGRMQKLGGGRRPLVVVDYAHTPDALEQVLKSLREVAAGTAGRIVCVFGCGGDRDRGKRPLMGAVASRLADSVVVTSDNPRSEDPRKIIADIRQGMRGDYAVEPDRRRAIALALQASKRGDIVLVAGKGHETYQETNGVRRPFSDVAVARTALQRRSA
jgi:UDP-N-acetylmuramyl-tripeptide synthetase